LTRRAVAFATERYGAAPRICGAAVGCRQKPISLASIFAPDSTSARSIPRERAMIGNCDCCDRREIPVGKIEAYGIETVACYICQAHGADPDPDPYGEMDSNPCPYAIDGCLLENQEIGPCLCAQHSVSIGDKLVFNYEIPVSYIDLKSRLSDCYEQRELPTWGEIRDAANAINNLMATNRVIARALSSWKERAEHAESVLAEQDQLRTLSKTKCE
jgi:hypothetical protein